MENVELLVKLANAKALAQDWYNTKGALSLGREYALVRLEVFTDYCPEKRNWVLVKRDHPETPYEVRCVLDPVDGFYVMALITPDKLGFIRDAFGPNYAEIAVLRSLIGTNGKDML
jgi:hypothetical protein